MTSNEPRQKSRLKHRLREEMRDYATISLYLWVCFSVLMLYENSLLQADRVQLLPMSTAAIKALIIGKFILIGRAMKVGEKLKHDLLLNRIAWKSLATLLLLMVFTVLEELVVGLAHGHAIAQIANESLDRPWLVIIAPSVVMLLVLIPMIAFEEIDRALGKGSLKRMLLERSKHE